MRTKLILGVAVGMAAVAQIASAQGVFSGTGNEILGPSFSAAQDSLNVSSTFSVTDASTPAVSFDNSVADVSLTVPTQDVDTTVVRRNTSDSMDSWSPVANWMDSGVQSDLTAYTPSESFSSVITDSGSILPSSPEAGIAGNVAGGAHVPNLGGPTPEPGTIQLLVLGGSALASGVISRRKK